MTPIFLNIRHLADRRAVIAAIVLAPLRAIPIYTVASHRVYAAHSYLWHSLTLSVKGTK
jgi:hypothetical protein